MGAKRIDKGGPWCPAEGGGAAPPGCVRPELENARRELEGAISARDDFLAAASHEIGTPLAIVELAVDGVRRALLASGCELEPMVFARLDRARRAARRLARIRDSLLEASRQRSGGIHLEPSELDLADVVREVTWDLVDVAERYGSSLHVDVSGPLRARVDRDRVGHAIACVVDNALKFGAGRPVEVRARDRGAAATVTVVDHGAGIAPEDQARIFEPFERAVSARAFGGLGFGLWTARRIVEASGGSLTLESRAGEGATFEIRLPLAV